MKNIFVVLTYVDIAKVEIKKIKLLLKLQLYLLY